MATEREWVRNHRHSGFVVGRFQGEFEGQPREMLVIQTLKGAVLVPSGSVLPITKADVIRQAALDLEPIVEALLEGGLDRTDIASAWEQAVAYHQKGITDAAGAE